MAIHKHPKTKKVLQNTIANHKLTKINILNYYKILQTPNYKPLQKSKTIFSIIKTTYIEVLKHLLTIKSLEGVELHNVLTFLGPMTPMLLKSQGL